MRSVAAAVGILTVLVAGPAASALARSPQGGRGATTKLVRAPNSPAERSLVAGLNGGMRQAGAHRGAYVVDLTAGRLPASVEKLYTTTTALQRFGASGTLTTAVLGQGQMEGTTYVGTLYLRGGGDPTFGAASFDTGNYGTGATIQELVSDLVAATGMAAFKGNVVADESVFDSDRGTPATNNRPSTE